MHFPSRLVLCHLFLVIACPAWAQENETSPDALIRSIIADQLGYTDAAELAWGGYNTAQYRAKGFGPQVLKKIVGKIRGTPTQQKRCRLHLLDALIQHQVPVVGRDLLSIQRQGLPIDGLLILAAMNPNHNHQGRVAVVFLLLLTVAAGATAFGRSEISHSEDWHKIAADGAENRTH